MIKKRFEITDKRNKVVKLRHQKTHDDIMISMQNNLTEKVSKQPKMGHKMIQRDVT